MPVGAPASGRKPFTIEVESRGALLLGVLVREKDLGQAAQQSCFRKLLLHHDFGTMSVTMLLWNHMLLSLACRVVRSCAAQSISYRSGLLKYFFTSLTQIVLFRAEYPGQAPLLQVCVKPALSPRGSVIFLCTGLRMHLALLFRISDFLHLLPRARCCSHAAWLHIMALCLYCLGCRTANMQTPEGRGTGLLPAARVTTHQRYSVSSRKLLPVPAEACKK